MLSDLPENQQKIIPHFPYRFDIETQGDDMLKYLQQNGYAVVKSVANQKEISEAKDLFWKWAMKLSSELKRDDPETWIDENWVGNKYHGICSFINHSEFVWKSRLLPKVKKVFASIWKNEDLIVSFDAGNAFRPWQRNESWKTNGGWWHIDQNRSLGKHREGMVCVQGFVNYYDANEETGGLCLFAKSHLNFADISARSHAAHIKIDYVPIKSEDPDIKLKEAFLICANAGDLVLWDSRTVHCNTPSLVKKDLDVEERFKHKEIIRLLAYVCMVPFSHASKEVIEKRKEGFIMKKPTSHWPTELITTTVTCEDESFEIGKCNQQMLELVGFRNKNCRCLIF